MGRARWLPWIAILACCADPVYSRSSGSLAISPDDDLAFVADEDNSAVAIVDLDEMSLRATVSVGARPQYVIAGEDAVFVSNRGARSVSVLRESDDGAWRVAGVARVGAEPTGLALSPDGKRLA